MLKKSSRATSLTLKTLRKWHGAATIFKHKIPCNKKNNNMANFHFNICLILLIVNIQHIPINIVIIYLYSS